MRELPSRGGGGGGIAVAKADIHLAPPAAATAAAAPPPICESQRCPWWPYSNSKDFTAKTALVLVFFICTLICAVACSAAVRYILRQHRARRWKGDPGGAPKPEVEIPSLVYSEGTKVTAAECAICLSEFAIGERIRVLEKCGHGFHLQCVQRWLASRSSCPTCRTTVAFPQARTRDFGLS